MRLRTKRLAAWPLILASLLAGPALASSVCPKGDPASIEAATQGLERKEGLIPVYLDRKCGRVLVLLRPSGADGAYGRFLYQVYLRGGLGSAQVGLDRSLAAETQILAFQRAGDRIVANVENSGFRADRGSADEARAVQIGRAHV